MQNVKFAFSIFTFILSVAKSLGTSLGVFSYQFRNDIEVLNRIFFSFYLDIEESELIRFELKNLSSSKDHVSVSNNDSNNLGGYLTKVMIAVSCELPYFILPTVFENNDIYVE